MTRRKYDTKPLTSAQEFARLVASVSYDERLKTVRAYYPEFSAKNGYDLRHELDAKQKRKVTKYYKQIRPFLSAPITKQKLRNEKESSAAWRWLHGCEPPLGTLYVPIHESPKNKPKLKFQKIDPEPVYDEFDNQVFKKGKPVYSEPDLRVTVKLARGVEAENYFFEDYGLTPQLIATDPELMLADMLDKIGAPRYAIVCGDNLFSNFSSKRRGRKDELRDNTTFIGNGEQVIKMIRTLQNMYADKTKNNYWGNWLMGVKAYFFKEGNDADFNKYRKEIARARLERVEVWREVRQLNRSIRTANDQIKHSEQNIKYFSSKQAEKDMFIPPERRRHIKMNKRYQERAEDNLGEAMKRRAALIMQLTNKL